jgi:hypothetical protein
MTKTRFSTEPVLLSAAFGATLLFFTTPVRAQQSFSLTASPSKVYVNEHGVAASTITIQPVNGFNGSVTLSVSGLPKGVGAAFRPPSTTSTSTLVFGAGLVAMTGATTVTVTGVSGSVTQAVSIPLAVSAAIGTGGSGTVAELSPAYNVYGIYTNGTAFSTGGLDGVGWAYSANLLTSSRVWNGTQFKFGPANQLDAVSGTGEPITLPAGQFGHLVMLATGVEGNQTAQIVKVTYTDGTTSDFALNFSDWFSPQSYPDEYEGVTMPYRAMADGGLDARGNFYLYAHLLRLDSSKTVEAITLPDNRHVVVLAVTLTAE